MTIEKARELLEKNGKSYSDSEIQELISTAVVLADLTIDAWTALPGGEKKKWREKNKGKDGRPSSDKNAR